MKRFAICLDGTWNNAAKEAERDDGSRVFKPTNVLKLARATEQFDTQGNLQITYYDKGVGATNRAPNLQTKVVRFFDNKLGGGWGAGFEVNIEEAYTFLTNNYSADDEIFIFGFSRGASQARSLVHLIEWVGGFPAKNDAYYIPKLFSEYLDKHGGGSGQALWDEMNARREAKGRNKLHPIVTARVKLLGVWDTVLALGFRFQARGGSSAPVHRFHTPNERPHLVDHVRHALAIDEGRHDFQPEIWNADNGTPSMQQRWFPGAHSNVGGGLLNDGLANGALHWIAKEAQTLGLELNSDFLGHYRGYPCDEASSKSLFYKIGDFLYRPVRGFGGIRDLNGVPGMTLDDSVFTRLNANPANHKRLAEEYRPKHLLEYLARNPQYDAKLKPDALAAVQKMR